MKRTLVALLSCIATAASLLLPTAGPASAIPPGAARQSFVLNPGPGWDIWNSAFPTVYRKSASVLVTGPASRAQFSCGITQQIPGVVPETIYLSTSTDYGHTWNDSAPVLSGTPGGADSKGVCDPNVVQYGGYYYMAYAGKLTSAANSYAIFVARSTSLSGPYVKWTGTGWGNGYPSAMINAGTLGYGATGPSMVVKGTTLYVYYDYHSGSTWQTRLATVDIAANAATWPDHIVGQGTVIEHPGLETNLQCWGGSSADSTDVKWVPQLARFVAVTTDGKTFAKSAIQTYESTDGVTFRKSITSRGEWVPNTHNASLVSDPQGVISPSTTRQIVFDHDDDLPNCMQRKIRMSPIPLDTASTGWIDEPLTSSSSHWQPRVGAWQIDPDEDAYAVQGGGNAVAWSILATSEIGDTATIDLDIANWYTGGWAGVQWGQGKATDDYEDSGYLVRVLTNGDVELVRAGFVIATGTTPITNNWLMMRHLQIVQTNGNISVYVARKDEPVDGTSQPVLTFNEDNWASSPYVALGGYLSLAASGDAKFRNLTVTDNAGDVYGFDDWQASIGSWVWNPPRTLTSQSQSAETWLRDEGTLAGDGNAHLGDGTYQATVRLTSGTNPNAKAGISITNYGATPLSFANDKSYVAMILPNGTVALDHPGPGTETASTGLNPVNAPVKLRVIKRGRSVQVYVNDWVVPVINYWEPGIVPQAGGFGIGNVASGATFTDIEYAADNGL